MVVHTVEDDSRYYIQEKVIKREKYNYAHHLMSDILHKIADMKDPEEIKKKSS